MLSYQCKRLSVALLFVLIAFAAAKADASDQIQLFKGQVVYVPAYSHIYSGNREQPFLLTVTLSIRNVNPSSPITITKVEYYETQGRLLRKFLDKPAALKPLESTRFVVPQEDKAGGSGANFIVEWRSDVAVNPPIIESIMIGTQSQQGLSFTSRGQAIHVFP